MLGVFHVLGRLLILLMAAAALVSTHSNFEPRIFWGSVIVLSLGVVSARLLFSKERYDRFGMSAVGFLFPIMPWCGSNILLYLGLLFFALRDLSVMRAGSAVVADGLIWIAPFIAYILGNFFGEVANVIGVYFYSPTSFDTLNQNVQVRIDGLPRVFDLLRSILGVHVRSWEILARVSMLALFGAIFSDNKGLIARFSFWLKIGAGISALFVIVQWLGFIPFILPNQTEVWNALGRPSGLMTDPNALGVFLGLVLWIAFLVPSEIAAPNLAYLWTVLILLAGVVSGSRTFLICVAFLAFGFLYRATVFRGLSRVSSEVGHFRRYRVLYLVLFGTLLFGVGLTTVIDAYSSGVRSLVDSNALPMGVRRGIAALSLLRINETLMSRGVFFEFAREIGRGHLWFGVGGDRFIDYVPLVDAKLNLARGWRDNSNNLYLGILTELGIAGLAASLLAVLGRRLRRSNNTQGSCFGVALLMLAAVGITGPHTNFIEILPLVGALIAVTSEARPSLVGPYRIFAILFFFLGLVASNYRELGVYGWSNTETGAIRWLSHAASVELRCEAQADQSSAARLLLEPRYIPQTEPLRVVVSNRAGAMIEVLFRNAESREVAVPCSHGEPRIFADVKTYPAWSPYRAWPRSSGDRRILGVQQVFRGR
jgi:hypothetical protein